MTRAGATSVTLWLVFLAGGAWLAAHTHYTADLSAFLPRSPTAAEQLLVDQLRDGFAARVLLIAIDGDTPANRARLSRKLASELRASGTFTWVNNGEPVGAERDRSLLFDHRYLLSPAVTPQRFTVEGLRAAIGDSIDLLASPAGLLVKGLLPRDPTGEMLELTDRLDSGAEPRVADGVWVSRDAARAVLVAQTRAAGSDTDAQAGAIGEIRARFAAAASGSSARLRVSGPAVFAVNARATIKGEVERLSLASAALVVTLLLIVYRSVPAVILGLIPVATGALAGVAAVSLGFGVVHGLTLGFGISLIGEAIDYSIYFFVQSRQSAAAEAEWRGVLWPTMRLGTLTSVCGFASLLPSTFPGLAQLGLYSIAGLAAAALVTRYVLPALLPRGFAVRDLTRLGTLAQGLLRRPAPLKAGIAILLLAAGTVLYLHRDSLWSRELAALSPVAAADQAYDAGLRADLGAPEPGSLVVVTGSDLQSTLVATEDTAARLQSLVAAKVIGGFDSPAAYLPSVALQSARIRSLPDETQLAARLRQAIASLPVHFELFAPFRADVAAARTSRPLLRADLEGSSLAAGFDALMIHHDARWSAILPLRAAMRGTAPVQIDASRVRAALASGPATGAVFLDLKTQSDRLYARYFAEATRLSLAGLAAIVILLLLALRSPARVIRVTAPLVIAAMSTAAGFALAGIQLTILHLIGMLLVVAVGSNYALFFDRRASRGFPAAMAPTLASLIIANLTTVIAFGVLAFSSVPALQALGATVAPGAFLALVLSGILAAERVAPAAPPG